MNDNERLERVRDVATHFVNNGSPVEIHLASLVLDAITAPESVTADAILSPSNWPPAWRQ